MTLYSSAGRQSASSGIRILKKPWYCVRCKAYLEKDKKKRHAAKCHGRCQKCIEDDMGCLQLGPGDCQPCKKGDSECTPREERVPANAVDIEAGNISTTVLAWGRNVSSSNSMKGVHNVPRADDHAQTSLDNAQMGCGDVRMGFNHVQGGYEDGQLGLNEVHTGLSNLENTVNNQPWSFSETIQNLMEDLPMEDVQMGDLDVDDQEPDLVFLHDIFDSSP